MTEEVFPLGMYEYGIRKHDGSTEAGFNTSNQALLTAERMGLDPSSYSIGRRPVGYWEPVIE